MIETPQFADYAGHKLPTVARPLPYFRSSMNTRLTIVSLLLLACNAITATAEDWVSLFDGKTLDGWQIKGGKAEYKVEDGTILGTTVKGSPNTFLCKGPFSDFVLEFDVRCDKPLNSGVQIRSHTYEKDTPQEAKNGKARMRPAGDVYGYQCEITKAEEGVAGNFWDEARRVKWLDDFSNKPAAAKAYKDDEWNHYKIAAQGDHIRSWVNGIACADFHDSLDASGFIGFQVHSVPANAGPYQVRWKNIRIRELKPGDKVE
jgi:hypothetical protein